MDFGQCVTATGRLIQAHIYSIYIDKAYTQMARKSANKNKLRADVRFFCFFFAVVFYHSVILHGCSLQKHVICYTFVTYNVAMGGSHEMGDV